MDPDRQRHLDVGRPRGAGDQDDPGGDPQPARPITEEPGLQGRVDVCRVQHGQMKRRKEAGQLRPSGPAWEDERSGVRQPGDRARDSRGRARVAR